MGPPCRNPLADLKNLASKRAPAYPLSIGLHLMTLRQKQKVAVLFTKVSTLTPKNFQPPAPGAPMGRSSPNYLVPVPGVCSTLSQNFTPIAPSCVEISSTVQTKKNMCVSRTDTNPPFAFQTAFPRGTDLTGFLQGAPKSYIRCL